MTCLIRNRGARFTGRVLQCVKLLISVGVAGFGFGSAQAALMSPRGAALFSSEPTALAVSVPAPKTVRLEWDFPVSLETPDLIFKVYHSVNLNLSLPQWASLTNVPGNLRSVEVPASLPMEFFGLTASNYLGESTWATH